jgi:hypothetical protein
MKPPHYDQWPAFYRLLRDHEPSIVHNALTSIFTALAWLIASASCYDFRRLHRFVKSNINELELDPCRGVLLLPTHRSLVDSFFHGAEFQSLVAAAFRPKYRLWHVPDASNYQFGWLIDFVVSHLNCVPFNRKNTREAAAALTRILKLLRDGHRVCVFPGAGRERCYESFVVDPDIGRLVLDATRYGAQIVTARMDGVPVWLGERMGGSERSKIRQLIDAVRTQTSGQDVCITYRLFNMDPWLTQPRSERLYAQLAEAIRLAVRPLYPPNPAEVNSSPPN